VRFWAKKGQKILLILVKIACVVTKWSQGFVENSDILLSSEGKKSFS
jgi:hypothetical protein